MLHLRGAFLAALLAVASIGAACSSGQSPVTTGASPGLGPVQQGIYLNASLYGMIDYQWEGDIFSWPTTLDAPSVPIVWMGPIFSADLQGVGAGKDMSFLVHGSTSDDGAWVNTLLYSKRIVYKDTIPNRVVFYQVTLRNVPLTAAADTANVTGSFDQKGAELWKYVQKIEYVQGTLVGTTVVPDVVFRAIDWRDRTGGQEPRLKLAFEKVPSESMIADSPSGGSMGMGR